MQGDQQQVPHRIWQSFLLSSLRMLLRNLEWSLSALSTSRVLLSGCGARLAATGSSSTWLPARTISRFSSTSRYSSSSLPSSSRAALSLSSALLSSPSSFLSISSLSRMARTSWLYCLSRAWLPTPLAPRQSCREPITEARNSLSFLHLSFSSLQRCSNLRNLSGLYSSPCSLASLSSLSSTWWSSAHWQMSLWRRMRWRVTRSSSACLRREAMSMDLFSTAISLSLMSMRQASSLLCPLLFPWMSLMNRSCTVLSFLFISVQNTLIFVFIYSQMFSMLASLLCLASLSSRSFSLPSRCSCRSRSCCSWAANSLVRRSLRSVWACSRSFWDLMVKLCISFFLKDSTFCWEMPLILPFLEASSERQAFWSNPRIRLVSKYYRSSSPSFSLSFYAQEALMEWSSWSSASAVAASISPFCPFSNQLLSLLRVSSMSFFLASLSRARRATMSSSLSCRCWNSWSFSCWCLASLRCMSSSQTPLNSRLLWSHCRSQSRSSSLSSASSCSSRRCRMPSFSALSLSSSRTSFCFPEQILSISASQSCFSFLILFSERCRSSISNSLHSRLSRSSQFSSSSSYSCSILGSSLAGGRESLAEERALAVNMLELAILEPNRLEALGPRALGAALAFMFMDLRFLRAIFSFCCSYFLRYSRSVGWSQVFSCVMRCLQQTSPSRPWQGTQLSGSGALSPSRARYSSPSSSGNRIPSVSTAYSRTSLSVGSQLSSTYSTSGYDSSSSYSSSQSWLLLEGKPPYGLNF